MARGHSNREIGAALFISDATVTTHLLHIFGKLAVQDRTEAVTVALVVAFFDWICLSGSVRARGEEIGRARQRTVGSTSPSTSEVMPRR